MKYVSTRNNKDIQNASFAILNSLSKDGGLYVPENFPKFSKKDLEKLSSLNYTDLCFEILKLFFDEFDENDLKDAIEKAYGKFKEKIVGFKKMDAITNLELFWGPTLAFKDMALSLLPYLLKLSVKKENFKKNIMILTATSGDTGKASLEAFKDVENTEITVLYPTDGVSEIQKLQMATTTGKNTHVYAIKGNFDDCQRKVKEIFENDEMKNFANENNFIFSSANSINIGRLLPQIVYYFYAYFRIIENENMNILDKIDVSVPTGNFGDILAGIYAKEMNLPIKNFIVASNSNNVLTDFFNTKIYDSKRNLIKTSSPSMDILISSNLERYLYLLCKDTNVISKKMNELKNTGKFKRDLDFPDDVSAKFATEKDVSETIYNAYLSYNYIMDPHSAIAFFAMKNNLKRQSLVISTASCYKFPNKILESLKLDPDKDIEKNLQLLSFYATYEIPDELKDLKNKKILHKEILSKNEIEEKIKTLLEKK